MTSTSLTLISENNGIICKHEVILDVSEKNRWVIGRDRYCDIILFDPCISRKHCTVFYILEDDFIVWKICDGLLGVRDGSKFGLWKSGKKVILCKLSSGDCFMISPTTQLIFTDNNEQTQSKVTQQ